MKNIFKYILQICTICILIVSCSNDDDDIDSTATPNISYVRLPTDGANDPIVEAPMNKRIAIIGTGMEGVREVLFNNIPAQLNPVYVTSTVIICEIPAILPEEVTNMIILNTGAGKSCEFEFTVNIPQPRAVAIDLEFAADGNVVAITGNSFFSRGDGTIDVTFPGDKAALILSFTDTQINVKVPVGAESGVIVIENQYGSSESLFKFRDKTGILIDGENLEEWNTKNFSTFINDDTSLDGHSIKLVGETVGWNNSNKFTKLFYDNPTGLPLLPVGTDLSEYAIKFEYHSVSWNQLNMVILFDNSGKPHQFDADRGQFHWKPFLNDDGSAFNYTTNGWKTKVIPLAEFKYDKEGTTDQRTVKVGEMIDLSLTFYGPATEGATSLFVDFRMDNLRLVKIK